LALIQKPTGPSHKDTTEPDMVVLFKRSGVVEQEKIEHSVIAACINDSLDMPQKPAEAQRV
jgi:hypothetical protein